jgi:aminoglycoside phosphotransferase
MQAVLPATEALTRGLAAVLGGDVKVLGREPNANAGRSPSELVTCLASGEILRLFCKYENGRAALAYEASVYREVLEPAGVASARFYGTHAADGSMWLVLGDLGELPHLSEIGDFESMVAAAGWLGRMHGSCEAKPFLRELRADDHLAFMHEAQAEAALARDEAPWLIRLGERYRELAPRLLSGDKVVCHGDFYTHNILVDEGRVYPVDWEEAALDVGETDLACLTDGWPVRYARACELAYAEARWPGGAPSDFDARVGLARLSLFFFNVARRKWLDEGKYEAYLAKLRRAGTELGLIPA